MARIGFIGVGNMGGALARAVCAGGAAEEVLLSNRTAERADRLASELGCTSCGSDNDAVARTADIVFLGVKPQTVPQVAHEAAKAMRPGALLVSMAAGVTVAQLKESAGAGVPVVRVMPNTPVSVGAGMTMYTPSSDVDDTALKAFLDAMASSGRLLRVDESVMDAGCALAGCGPAFVDLFVEALADGGVACGLSRADALEMAEQTVEGAARLAAETGKHPGQLKDEVCSPGGSTVQGVRLLERRGFRSAAMDAVVAAYKASKGLAE